MTSQKIFWEPTSNEVATKKHCPRAIYENWLNLTSQTRLTDDRHQVGSGALRRPRRVQRRNAVAQAYLAAGVVTAKFADDARHVALCAVHHVDHLVSWNFRHLVNVRREAGFNAVNLLQGYPSVSIVNPKELIYGNDLEQDL